MRKGCLFGSIFFLLLMTVGLIYYFTMQGKSDERDTEFTHAEVVTILDKAVASGSIVPRLEVNIKPQVSGVIEKVYVEAGQQVTKGQKLVKIKLIPSEVNVNNARSNVDLAKLQLQEASREMKRQQSVYEQKLDVQDAKSSLGLAEVELSRQSKLFADGVVSEQDYNRMVLDRDLKMNLYENAMVRAQSNLDQYKSNVEMRRQELQSAENNLQLMREGVTKNSKQVSNIVRSTIDGMILDIPIEEGSSVIERNTFNEGTSIAVIADMNSIIFEGKIDESDIGKLKEGMPLEMTVGAIPNEKFSAILEFLSPKGKIEEGTVKFEIKAAIKEYNKDIFLRAGYSANADVIIDRRDSVLAIMERDVIYKDDKSYFDMKTGNEEVEQKEITLGLSDGLYAEILSGIEDTTVQYKIQN